MRVSVITVSFNAAGTLRTAMESVLVQRREGALEAIEYLVVDGGSTDGTVELLERFAETCAGVANFSFRWLSEADRGLYDAINKGIRLATGDVIGLLNADDALEHDLVLSRIAGSFADGIDGVYGDVRFVRAAAGDLSAAPTVRYYSSREWRPWMHYWGYMPAHPTVYVRRAVYAKYGDYRLGYEISADFEWMVRVLCRGRLSVRYLPECLVTMRLGGKSTAGLAAMYRLNVENVRANRENGFFCCLPMMLPKYAYKILGYFKGGRKPE